jgi:CHAT domain-containing protein
LAEPPLEKNEALISFCDIEGAVLAFVQTQDGLNVSKDLASAEDVAAAARRLSYQWGRFRLGRDVAQRHSRLLLADTLEDLNLLHGLLVAPLTQAEKKNRWIVVPSRSMASVPMAALYDGESFLVERKSVVVSPSVAVFGRCRDRLRRRGTGTLVVGQTGPVTPEVQKEVSEVARVSRRPVQELTGREATADAIRRLAAGKAVVHLASHGFFHAERPKLSGLKLSDRWFHAHDAASLDLKAELVVLSACQSGLSHVLEGDEWLGLPGAFLKSGAARVLASLWDVDDLATRRLMTQFARAWARERGLPSQALRKAQVELLGRFQHPYYWAGFQIVGTP